MCDFCRSDQHISIELEARDYEYRVPGVFTLARCTLCDFYYQIPRPSQEIISTFYPSTYCYCVRKVCLFPAHVICYSNENKPAIARKQ